MRREERSQIYKSIPWYIDSRKQLSAPGNSTYRVSCELGTTSVTVEVPKSARVAASAMVAEEEREWAAFAPPSSSSSSSS